MAVLAPTFDLFVAAYLEPMLYLTHSRVQSCFPSGVEVWAPPTLSSQLHCSRVLPSTQPNPNPVRPS
jgi:hypothetical protein